MAGLSLWWLITIHLAAAVNIDSSRDFQFEPCDTLWNITKCVEVRKVIGRGDRSDPRGQYFSTFTHTSSPYSCLSICLTPRTLHFYQFKAIEWSMSSYSALVCCASPPAYQTHWSLICSHPLSPSHSSSSHSGPVLFSLSGSKCLYLKASLIIFYGVTGSKTLSLCEVSLLFCQLLFRQHQLFCISALTGQDNPCNALINRVMLIWISVYINIHHKMLAVAVLHLKYGNWCIIQWTIVLLPLFSLRSVDSLYTCKWNLLTDLWVWN